MPQQFCDGKSTYARFIKDNICHKKGLFIVAPSGSGKTYFVENQKEKHWIDGDKIWTATGAQPNRAWWSEGMDVIHEVDQKCDVITAECKKLGLWVIGASNYWLVPDAIVIPDWRIQKKYIIHREQTAYDGGATSKDFDQVLGHRKALILQAKRQKVPTFKSLDLAVAALKKMYSV